MGFRIEQSQVQAQVLAPYLRQSLKILQASALDLRAIIHEEMQLNPTLEELPTDSVSIESSGGDFSEKDYEYGTHSKDFQAAASKKHDFLLDSLTSEVSLQDHLREQVGCFDLPDKLYQVICFIIGSLNEKGFLELPMDEVVLQTGTSYKIVTQALKIVQQLDPVGVGCKNVEESLRIQLYHNHKANSLADRIISQCYPLLLRNRIADIAKTLSVSVESVQNAIRQDISILDPAPGRRFQSHPSQGVIPDVRIYKNGQGDWTVELNNQYIPQLQIGHLYKEMLGKNIKTEDRNYLRLKIRSGRFFIQAILQRQKTIEQIARTLLNKQIGFFEQGPNALKPLTLQVIAESMGVHETTVSRAIANKYVDTPFGVFSFKYFFTKGLNSVTGESISSSIIKKQVRKIIEGEDKKHPLSDQRIANMLTKNSVQIARRTITKYRELLGIPAASLRRQYD